MAQFEHLFSNASRMGLGKMGGALMTGMIVSFLLIIMSISYPSMIFGGRLEEYSGMGIQMALFSAMIFCFLLSLISTCPGVVGIAQGETAAVIGLATASIAEICMESGNSHQALPTVMAVIALSAFLVGLLFTSLGALRLANLIRFVPLPVMGGFLAGVGWLLSSGAIKSMTGLQPTQHNLAALLGLPMILKWLPGLVSALMLLMLQRHRQSVFNLFIAVIATVSLFWLTVWLAGVSSTSLRADGWLMATGTRESEWAPFDFVRLVTEVDWSAVFSQIPQLGALLVISSISLLMATSSLELLSGKDMDLNRELIAAGLGNFICAAVGSLPGYHSLGASTLSQKMGAPVRMVGLVSGVLCAIAYAMGVSFLSLLPKMLVGTVVLYIAMSLLVEWLYDAWAKLPLSDYSILLLVFGSVCFVGIINGVAIGLVASVLLFAYEYGRIGITRQVGSSESIRSNVVRPEPMNAVLREFGRESHIVKLQGFIFFGASNSLLNQIRSRMLHSGSAPLRCVVFDFKHVFGIDSSAALSFLKLRRYAENLSFTIALSHLSPQIDSALRVAGVYEGSPSLVSKFDDLDHALEYCEKIIISAHSPPMDEEIYPVREQLRRAFADSRHAQTFEKYLEPVLLARGEFLIRQRDGSDDLFFIERGRVAVILEKPDGSLLRVNAMGPGTVVGEIAFLLGSPRSANVVVEADIVARKLTRKSLVTIRKHDPELAVAFHEFLARMLSERLVDANRLIQTD